MSLALKRYDQPTRPITTGIEIDVQPITDNIDMVVHKIGYLARVADRYQRGHERRYWLQDRIRGFSERAQRLSDVCQDAFPAVQRTTIHSNVVYRGIKFQKLKR